MSSVSIFYYITLSSSKKNVEKRPRKIDGMITFCVSFHFPHSPFVSNQIAVCCWCCCVVCVRADSCGLKRNILYSLFFSPPSHFPSLSISISILHSYSRFLCQFISTHPSTLAPDNSLSPIVFWEVTFCVRQFCGLSELKFVVTTDSSMNGNIIHCATISCGKTHSFIRFNVDTYISRWIKLITMTSEDYERIQSFFHGSERKEGKRKGWKVIFNDCHEWRWQRRPSMTMARAKRKNERKN